MSQHYQDQQSQQIQQDPQNPQSQHPTGKHRPKISLRVLVSVSMLAAISFILASIEVSIPIFPTFLKMDFSDFPAFIIAFAFSPIAGVLVELVKNILGLFTTSTGGVGELANFVINASMVFTAGFIYHRHKTKKSAVIGLAIGTVVKAIVGGTMNYFVLLPLYSVFIPIDTIIQMSAEIVPFINSKLDVVLYSIVPFNLLKGIIVSLITIVIYKKISPILKDQR